ncbi:vacuolar protein sorting-associated protein 4B-like [Ixodes scapularis]|uniref:vacuolar protein sorting-associated protein 4B-like n=1 Tax=Ixodes scapularis TaxID=6945 RepID=UPI001A9D7B75|nr:vacuolar protein sorting-associated protein 4B-like [Ixodes scapularis]
MAAPLRKVPYTALAVSIAAVRDNSDKDEIRNALAPQRKKKKRNPFLGEDAEIPGHKSVNGSASASSKIKPAPSTDGMNAEEAVRRAADFANRAAAEDAADNYGEAFSLYKHALFLYFLAAKEIRLESSSYIERTHEFIRARGCEDTKAFHTSGVVVLGEAQVRWSDVFGLETLKRALMLNVVYPVKHPTLFEDAKPLTSLMLYGPTGCGKSHVGKALATECNDSTFFYVMCQHFASKCLVGNENLTVRTLFEMVLNHAPSVLFLDELDALSGSGMTGETSGFLYRVKADFLSLLEGLLFKKQITVIGATKSPWAVDPALARVFRKWSYVPLPSEETRDAMLRSLLKEVRHQFTEEDFTSLAVKTEGFTCEDISLSIREARIEVAQSLKLATHFCKVEGFKRNGAMTSAGDFLTPCKPDTPGAMKMSCKDIPKEALLEPELNLEQFDKAIQKLHPSVTSGDLKKLEAFRVNQEANGHSVLTLGMNCFPSDFQECEARDSTDSN